MERGLVITLNLIVCLLELYPAFLQLNLNERESVHKDSYIIAASLAAFNSNLIGDLELVLAPMVPVKEFYPNTFAVFCFQWEKVTKLLGLLEQSTALKMDADSLKLLIGELSLAHRSQLFGVMLLELLLEVRIQVCLLLQFYILVAHVLKGGNQTILKCLFTLCCHSVTPFRFLFSVQREPFHYN